MFKRFSKTILLLVLVAAVLLPTLSCAASSNSVTTDAQKTQAPITDGTPSSQGTVQTNAPTTTALNYSLHDIPDDVRFDGAVVNFAYIEGEGGKFTERSIKYESDDNDGDKVDTLVFERNERVEERLGVTINPIRVAEGYKNFKEIYPALRAGTTDYDVLVGFQYYEIITAQEGFVQNINKLEGNYIDIEKPYWGTNYIKEVNYKDQIYWLSGDLALRYSGGMFGTFINSRIYEQELFASYGDIYELARSGNGKAGGWTVDTMLKMANTAYKDTGSIQDAVDEQDQIGFLIETKSPTFDALAYAWGLQLHEIDPATGKYKITFNSANERLVSICSTLTKITENPTTFFVPMAYDSLFPSFASGGSFCAIFQLFKSELFLRDMTDDFFVLPIPKMNETDLYYGNTIHDGNTIFAISASSPQKSCASATLELMAAEGFKTVVPEYYDSALKYKYTRDDGAAEMIDIIRAGVRTDFVGVWSYAVNDLMHIFRNPSTVKTINTHTKKTAKSYESAFNKVVEKLEALSALENEGK